MNLLEYTEKAHETCEPQCFNEEYLTLGLISEVGELAGKMKRSIRENAKLNREDILYEIGDCLWYISQLYKLRGKTEELVNVYRLNIDIIDSSIYKTMMNLITTTQRFSTIHADGVFAMAQIWYLAKKFNATLEEVLVMNIEKLQSRKKRGVICGEGDNR